MRSLRIPEPKPVRLCPGAVKQKKKLRKRESVEPSALLSGLRPQGRRPRGAHHLGDRTAVTFRV